MSDDEFESAIAKLLEETAPEISTPSPRNKLWRLNKKVAKADSLMRRTRYAGYCPTSKYISRRVRVHTTLHSGVYVKGSRTSGRRQFIKRQSAKKVRNFQGAIPDGNWWHKLFDFWWTLC